MDLALRAAVAFLIILFVTRVVGRRELSSMEPFDMILLIVMGDIAQQGITQNDYSVTGLVIVVSVMLTLTVVVAVLNYRFAWLRPVLEGGLVVLIEDGRILHKNLRRERLTVEEVESAARVQQIGSLDDVRLAVLETSGQISFIPKEG